MKQDRLDQSDGAPVSDSAFGPEQMVSFGQELRRLRLHRAWSLQRMATESGVSVAGIQKIERGTTNPSLQTALSLSEALGLPLPDLIAAARAARPPVDAGAAPRIADGVVALAGNLTGRRMLSQMVVLAPKSSLEPATLVAPLFMYVVRGSAHLHFKDGRRENLASDDAIHMRQQLPIRLENTQSQRAVILCVSDRRQNDSIQS